MSIMKRIMHILFLSCLKATELIEKKLHFRLSFKEKLQLKIHKLMCEACQRYEKHSELLDKGIANALKEIQLDDSMDDLKIRIVKSLENNSN